LNIVILYWCWCSVIANART